MSIVLWLGTAAVLFGFSALMALPIAWVVDRYIVPM